MFIRLIAQYVLGFILLIASSSALSNAEFTYNIIDEGIEIAGCAEECPSDLIIPDVIDGFTVASIGELAFYGDRFNSVIIPNSVTSIGVQAFLDTRLTSLDIPVSVTSIAAFAFDSNRLTSLIIPESISIIESYTFAYNLLTSLTISGSVTIIEDGAFESNKLTSLTIPNRITNIGYGAFVSNPLTSISFLGDRPEIGEAAFEPPVLQASLLQAIYYCDYASGWPGAPIEGVTPQLNETCDEPEPEPEPEPISYATFDIDQNESVDALTDGLILLRYFFGLRGGALIDDVIANNATRTTAAEIEAYIESHMP